MAASLVLKLLFSGPVLVMTLYLLSPILPLAGFAARVLAGYLSLALCGLFGTLASIVMTLTGYQHNAQWLTARSFQLVMRWSTGVRFVVDDPRHILDTVRPAVLVGNHQTELDVLMLGAMFPKRCSVTAKSALKHVPLLGWFMRLSGTIFIDRANAKGAREAMQGAALEIRHRRQSVYIFPEGTRSYAEDPVLLPFKKGAFHLAIQAAVPIIPCVVANYSHILSVKKLVFTPGTIPVKVLDPIPTEGLDASDVDELARLTYDVMLKEYAILSAKAKGRPMPVPR
ncbi:hypothetical protein L249_6595 [Ophiocordyceps polyrhachis-furcata BCC 54312]|uniref:1-acyl-sn-glycerol-3-phosphate acyltransferase n=1 Tax=Ophiocordyceps polyrhachis-furcata BCC 54312 TaxID=1330021 RepID=A0A367LL39_9HYPO|nr:hypothetical protein L249_6595 [Ophiocordyceps polyrhachis-furcata BCC 54312]